MIPVSVYRLAMANAYAPGGFDAGAQMYTFYPTSNRVFPVLNDDPEILPDTPADSWGLAWYLGRNPEGRPKFAVRDDILLNPKIAWHEAGHALEGELIVRFAQQMGVDDKAAENVIRSRYWNWRQFDGTWWDAYLDAQTKGVSGGWAYLPGESIAESLSAATGGYVESEWTMSFGRDLSRIGIIGGAYSPSAGGLWARQFWQQLCSEVDMDEAIVERIATAKANEAVERYAAAEAEWGWKPFKKAFNFHDHGVLTSNGAATDMKTSGPRPHPELDPQP